MLTILFCIAALGLLFEFYQFRRRATLYKTRCPFALLLGGIKSEPSDSSSWEERYIGGSEEAEAEFINSAVADIHRVQQNNKEGAEADSHKRAFHAKIHAGVDNAELRVCDDIPEHLQVGILQPGERYITAVRLSNASGQVRSDKKKDLQGLAAKVVTDSGDHDFLATNGAASHARDAYQFISFAKAMSGSKLLLLPRLIWYVGLLETVRMLATVIRQGSRKKESLAKETYFSRAAYSVGGQALMFRFVPRSCADATVADGDNRFREDIVERLKLGPVVFDLQVQLFVNEGSTPIEDGSHEWKSRLTTIAHLTIPQQDLTASGADEMHARVDNLDFNPWNVTEGFRPIGSQNRARLLVYKASVALRKGAVQYVREHWLCRLLNRVLPADKPDTDKKGRCPVGRDLEGNEVEGPGVWRPKSSREGIGPMRYVAWNAFYFFLQTLNRGLARDPNRKISWDKWPSFLGLFYLLAKIRFNRSNALTDPYDYAANDTKSFDGKPEDVADHMRVDGTYVSDDENPQMGAENTRFGSNIPPKRVRPDIENMRPSAREIGKLRWRKIDPETGREITVKALILNDMAGGWIQFQFHGFGGDTKRDPVGVCPHMLKREPGDNWPEKHAKVDRTSVDHTRVTDNGRPTPLNERVQAWIQGQIYGTNEEELRPLRTFEGGKFRLDENGMLPEDPDLPGIDHTGFNKNFNPQLSFLHWLFVCDHNAIADHYRYFHPDWDDEKLFRKAAQVNIAQIARIHTIQWTEDLLQHPTLQIGMHADWYGFFGQKAKMWIMRLCHRHPCIERLTRPIRNSDTLWGMPGSAWEHHDGPFQVPKQFRLVYRLHELILSEHEIIEPGTDRTLDRIDLLNFVHHNTRPVVERFGYDVLGYSFVRKSCGALTLHNFPRALTEFRNQQDGEWTDLAERDIFRELTDGTGSYNEFRQSVGEPPVTTFMELTGGDAELAREIEIKFEGEIELVPAGIGILCEPKPAGFALGFTQFYQFVLNAPRRVKSNRYLTQLFTYAHYEEGMDWIEHGGGMLGVMYRHLPKVRPYMEGVTRAFAPWKDVETFPFRQLQQTHEHTANVFKADVRTLGIGVLAGILAVATGASHLWFVLLVIAGLVAAPAALAVRRMLAMRFMQRIWQKCYTDKRGFMFGTLSRAEYSIERSAHFGRIHADGVIAGGLLLAVLSFFSGHTILGFLLLAMAISGISTWKYSNRFALDAQVLKIALRNRMRVGQPTVPQESLVGETDLERRCAFDPETDFNLTYAYGDVNDRLYRNGHVDLEVFERMFRRFAPGRDHMTAYDFARMYEAESIENVRHSTIFGWIRGSLADRRRVKNLLFHFGDRVVEEDKKLVPAISKETLLRYYLGIAQAELKREREDGDTDPSEC